MGNIHPDLQCALGRAQIPPEGVGRPLRGGYTGYPPADIDPASGLIREIADQAAG
jgi:hypothetical protein